MKKIFFALLLLSAFLIHGELFAERRTPQGSVKVKVQYQIKGPSSNSWTTNSATLTGAIKESMMINQLRVRHPRHSVRILAATTGQNIRTKVQYQIKRGKSSWTTGNATLLNAMTTSMAKNQLRQRHPGCQVRILSIQEQR